MRTYPTGATRNANTDKIDIHGHLSPHACHRYAEVMNQHRPQADGSRRDASNWQKGMAPADYVESFARHVNEAQRAWDEGWLLTPKGEEILAAVWFNVQGLLFESLVGRGIGPAHRTTGAPANTSWADIVKSAVAPYSEDLWTNPRR